MKLMKLGFIVLAAGSIMACNNKATTEQQATTKATVDTNEDFQYVSEQFADLRVLRYKVDGFDQLNTKQKELLYYLYEAALAGRDIIWDQNNKHNITVRRTLEAVMGSGKADTTSGEYKKFAVYAKRVWFSNGIHHHYSSDKIQPEFSQQYFAALINSADKKDLPLQAGESVDDFIKRIVPIVFDPKIAPKRVNLDSRQDLVQTSATNFYEGVTEDEVQTYYSSIKGKEEKTPVSYGLNSKVVKENGKVVEKVWKVGGMYSPAIEKIVYWLDKAIDIAENEQQKRTLEKLAQFYKTGDLKAFDEYNIEWVKDTASVVDVVNGFIEVYGDPLGYKGSFESVVSIKDLEATKRIEAISKEAQWFEDNSPISPAHKKKDVKGISAKVITVVVESGDAAPSTPIGINLPNAEWIRETHGSKSVSLGNIMHAYEKAKGTGMLQEFAFNDTEIKRATENPIFSDLHTDMHEVIGHASGQINKGVGTPKETLKNYASTLEEARADLVGLYFIMDQKLVDIGVMPSIEGGKAAYDHYIRNGLISQLVRIKLGDNLEEAHMRNRQLVAKWAFEKGSKDNVIEKKTKEGKTYFVINDYQKLRTLFGELLKEIQRIKSEGDYNAGKNLVENYGVKVDQDLHKEVLARYEKLNIAPYAGFINPRLVPVKEGDKIVDVKIEYPIDFTQQMLHLGKEHSFLPAIN